MKVLLIHASIHDEYDDRSVFPLGVHYLAAALIKEDIHCDVIDASLFSDVNVVISRALLYDLIGISSNSITFNSAVLIAESIKASKNVPIILGGYHATFKDKEILENHDCFDLVVKGEGEGVIVNICRDYFGSGKFNQYNGVSYKNINGKRYLSNDIIHLDDIDEIPFPIRDGIMNYRKVTLNNIDMVRIPVITSRGCPFGCNFCCVNRFRKKIIYRDINKIAEEVKALSDLYGNIYVAFTDDNFYIDINRAKEIINNIRSKCKKPLYFSFTARTDMLVKYGEQNLTYFKQNGCHYIEVGVENGCENILRRFNKKITVQQNLEAIRILRKAKINHVVNFILYDPWITVDELKENLAFMKRANLFGYHPPILFNRIKPIPGNYYDGLGIKMESYFKNNDVSEIANCMMMYYEKYQLNINLVIAKIRQWLGENGLAKDRAKTSSYGWLTMLPYRLIEELVTSNGDYLCVYNDFMKESDIDTHLEKMLHANW